MNLYLSGKERQVLIDVCTQWCEMLESADEDLVTPMLENGLGNIFYKLYKGKNGEEVYRKYADKHNNRNSKESDTE